ncbi:MAG: ribosomal L7Ae/L30e/S12e/Gadd45 family protein [Firmicutes bacterium]|nr:hypothetical protein [Clostridiales bacterium]MBQ9931951.1 ribosomal L7Ae/L30e/S12e/Gadd45 family protein [Bacillota bacterium]
MRKKIHSYIGFAKRSRNLVSGSNSCEFACMRKPVYLLILADDLSENTIKKFTSLANRLEIPVRRYETREVLSEMAGEADTGVFAVTDKNLANAILKEIDEEVCS